MNDNEEALHPIESNDMPERPQIIVTDDETHETRIWNECCIVWIKYFEYESRNFVEQIKKAYLEGVAVGEEEARQKSGR